MKHMIGLKMEVRCNKQEVIGRLKENLVEHASVFAEAKKTYALKAQAELQSRLDEFKAGRFPKLYIELKQPVTYESEYNTVIKMLEAHADDTITLSADEFRMFMEDKWDWTEAFLGTNSAYSSLANQRLALSSG